MPSAGGVGRPIIPGDPMSIFARCATAVVGLVLVLACSQATDAPARVRAGS